MFKYSEVVRIKATSEKASGEALIQTIERAVGKLQPKSVHRAQDSIVFRTGSFRTVHNWNLLVPITSGSISIDRKELTVSYELSFLKLLYFGIFIAMVFGGFLLLSIGPKLLLLPVFLVVVGLVCVWLLGMNYLVAKTRFKSMISKCIQDSAFEVI